MRFVPFCILLLALPAFATINGETVCPDKEPKDELEAAIQKHTVRIVVDDQTVCSGFAIAEREIITAAHCLAAMEGAERREVLVYDSTKKSYTAVGIATAQASDGKNTDDLGLLRLRGPVPKGAVAEVSKKVGCDDFDIVQAGFGRTEYGRNPRCATYTRYQGMSMPQNQNHLFRAKPIEKPDGRNQHVCAGDSGSPTFCKVGGKWTLNGLSYGAYVDPKRQKVAKYTSVKCKLQQGTKDCADTCRAGGEMEGYRFGNTKDEIQKLRETFTDPTVAPPPELRGTIQEPQLRGPLFPEIR